MGACAGVGRRSQSARFIPAAAVASSTRTSSPALFRTVSVTGPVSFSQ